MSKPLISKRSVSALIEYMSDWCVLREVNELFGHADIIENESHNSKYGTQRRSLADRYIASLDLTTESDAEKLLSVYAEVLSNLQAIANQPESDQAPDARKTQTIIENCLKADGFIFEDMRVKSRSAALGLGKLGAIAESIDPAYVRNQVRRLEQCVEGDPEAAIGGAKELIESCCKTILADHGIADADTMDVPKLIKETNKALKLTPEDVPDTARGKDAMKRLLGSLSTVAVSLAELRNEYGTGHGKHGKARTPKARHARLAVGCAATLVTFLFETHELQKAAARTKTSP